MTDNEIIKALETCCGDNGCFGCPYTKDYSCRLLRNPIKDALDLINRQKAEIERLNYENLQTIASIKHLKAEAIKEFAERLKKETKGLIGANFIDNLVKEMVGDGE